MTPREWPDVRDTLNECSHVEFAQVVCCAACLDAALNDAYAAGVKARLEELDLVKDGVCLVCGHDEGAK